MFSGTMQKQTMVTMQNETMATIIYNYVDTQRVFLKWKIIDLYKYFGIGLFNSNFPSSRIE